MKKCIVFLLAVVLMLSFSSCGESESISDDGSFRIVTSFYPVYIAAMNITHGAENVTLTNMTEPQTGCLHDYSLTTSDMKKLENADLLIISGFGMESFMEKPIDEALHVVDSSMLISEHILADEDEINPHYWMNINNAILQCKAISAALITENPENEAVYRRNTDEYVAKLEALRKEADTRMAALRERNMVVFHESFHYFAEEFGLNVVAVISHHDGSAPSPSELAETVRFMRENNIRSVFTEVQYPSAIAKAVARETGAKVYSLDSVVSGELDRDAYINATRSNLDTFESALG